MTKEEEENAVKQKLDETQKNNEQDMTKMIVKISWAITIGIIIACKDEIRNWSDIAKCSVFLMFLTSLLSIFAELKSCEYFKNAAECLSKFLAEKDEAYREKGFNFDKKGGCCVCIRNKLFYLTMFFLAIFILIFLSEI